MRNTWLVNTPSPKLKALVEIYYYFMFFFKFFNHIVSLPDLTTFFYFKRVEILARNTLLLDSTYGRSLSLLADKNRAINKFRYLDTHLFFEPNVVGANRTNSVPSLGVSKVNLFGSSKLLALFCNMFFLINYVNNDNKFLTHHSFHLFGVQVLTGKAFVMDMTKFFKRWFDTYALFFNIFFYKMQFVTFGASFFKKEILALNWYLNYFELSTWNYSFPFFIFKLNSFNQKIEFFLEKLKNSGIGFYVVSDCFYHSRLLHYFRKQKLYTIGIVPNNVSPWVVTYPIPVSSTNHFTQFFFLKLLIYTQKHAHFAKYSDFRSMWTRVLFLNKVKTLGLSRKL